MSRANTTVAEQFSRFEQQHEADSLGMWVFIASEIMLFGGLFLAMLIYRVLHPQGVKEAAGHLQMVLAGINTAVLLTSSLAMAIAATAAERAQQRVALRGLIATTGFGLLFLAIKAVEYGMDYREGLVPGFGIPSLLHEPSAALFLNLYFTSTGLHAIHLLIGIVLVSSLIIRFRLCRLSLPQNSQTVAVIVLYWHLVDIIWVFLYPVLYLIGR